MRVYLTFKHLQPGVFQIFFQRKVPHLFPVQGLLGGQLLRHGVFHLVEGGRQRPTSSLLFTGRSGLEKSPSAML